MARLPIHKKKRKQYRKQYPGKNKNITEEMRFVALRLCNIKSKKLTSSSGSYTRIDTENTQSEDEEGMEGFVKYLVDSKLVFNTLERIVDESNDVASEYFFLAIFYYLESLYYEYGTSE
ncbi:hypothetical protein GQ457_14G011920 [Hibiscus cannabinus]